MKSKDIDWENPYEVWEYLMQPAVEREPNEIDEYYRERILKYMKDKPISEESEVK